MKMKLLAMFMIISLTACNSTQRTMVETTTVNEKEVEIDVGTEVETKEEAETEIQTEISTYDKWANYSAEVREIIEKYEGKDVYRDLIGSDGRIKNYDQMKKEAELLADNDLYIVGFNTWGMPMTDLIKGFKDYNHGNDASKTWTEEEMLRDVNNGTIQIMTWDEATEWGLNFYKKYGDRQEAEIKGIGEAVIIPQAFGVNSQVYDKQYNDYPSPITNASHLYTANYQHEVYTQRQEYLNQYILRNETAGSPAKYINALGGRVYFRDEVSGNVYTADGQSWGSNDRNGYNWCKNRGVEFKDYRDVELLVFKKNNPDTILGDLPFSYSYTKYKAFHSGNGEPRWVERDPSAIVYDIYGYKLSPILYKSIEKYSQYCGGTLVAFNGYVQYVQGGTTVSTFYYDRIMEGVSPEDVIISITDMVKENPYYN